MSHSISKRGEEGNGGRSQWSKGVVLDEEGATIRPSGVQCKKEKGERGKKGKGDILAKIVSECHLSVIPIFPLSPLSFLH
jgi:hypothetical protein